MSEIALLLSKELGFHQVIAIGPDGEAYETGFPFIEKAGMVNKIQFVDSDGIAGIKKLLHSKLEPYEAGSLERAIPSMHQRSKLLYVSMSILTRMKAEGTTILANRAVSCRL